MEAVKKSLSLLLRRYGKEQALLFTGAGFSSGAANVNGKSIPTGRSLIKFFQDQLDDDADDLSILSQMYIKKFGESGLFTYLSNSFQVNATSKHQNSLLQFPWRSIYTTNYDNVAEFAAAQVNISCRTYTTDNHPDDIANDFLPIIHLNGFINSITFRDFLTKIKLTHVSYLTDDVSKSEWGQKFRSDILTSSCVVFIGYSMYDIDIARILYSFPGMKEKIYFITNPNPGLALETKLNEFGSILDMGLDKFADFIMQVIRDGFANPELFFTNITHIEKPVELKGSPSDSDVRDLLVWGDLNENQLASDIRTGAHDYILERDCVSVIADAVGRSALVNVVLQSRAGNGKSICLDAIGHSLNARTNEVFKIGNATKRMFEELPQIKSLLGKKIFLIEDIFSHFDTIRAIQALNLPEYAIICTARSTVFDLREAEARQLFQNDLLEFDLDRLSDVEKKNLIRVWTSYRRILVTSEVRRQRLELAI